jgi:fibronectin-binding autotransporter adhesin
MPLSLVSRLRPFIGLFALAGIAAPAAAQNNYTWNPNTTNTNWLDPGNWTGGPAGTYPGAAATDLARFNQFFQGTFNGVGIDFGATGGNLSLGAINFTSNSFSGIQIGNSSTTTAGTLRLNGATIDGVPNVVLADTGFSYGYYSIENAPYGSGGPGMTLQLGTANAVFMSYSSFLWIDVPITEAAPGSGVTIRGGMEVDFFRPNTYSGPTRIIGSTLGISQDNRLGIAPVNPTPNHIIIEPDSVTGFRGVLTTRAATFEIDPRRGIAIGPASGTGEGEINVPDPTVIGYTPTITYNGVIANNGSGTGRLVVTGGGKLVLGGSNTFTGGTLLTGGELRLTNVNALGTAGTVTLSPQHSNDIGQPYPGNLLVEATGTFARPVVVTYSGATEHPVVIGTPDFAAGGAVTAFSGGVTLNRAATVQGGSDAGTWFTGAFAGAADLTVTATAPGRRVVFNLTGATPNSFGNLTIAPDATLQLGSGFNNLANKLIPDTSSITFAAGGRLDLRPEGTDQEKVNALISPAGVGVVETIGGNTTTTFTLTVGAGDGSGSFGGSIQQATGKSKIILVKSGAGTQILTGANTYTGGTTVAAGMLLVNGQTGTDSGTGTGAVSVTGGVFGGTGRAAGQLTVNSGGTLRAGDSTATGMLTVGNGVIMNSGSNLSVRLNALGASGVAAGSGGSSNSLTSPTNHNYLLVTGGTSSLDPGINIIVDGTGLTFDQAMYSYKIAQLPGTQSGIMITDPSRFTFVGFTVQSASLTGDSGGAVYLNFTPVPEPAVLGIAAGSLALGGLFRRRFAVRRG